MCIRDRPLLIKLVNPLKSVVNFISKGSRRYGNDIELTPISKNVGVAKLNLVSDAGKYNVCLLYTSDAADERSSVDLGGRRIIKKKKKQNIRVGDPYI